MRILITGGAGYIGTILVPMLLGTRAPRHGLGHIQAGTPDLSAACLYDGFEPIKGDARDTRILDDLVPKHDVSSASHAALVGKRGVQGRRDRRYHTEPGMPSSRWFSGRGGEQRIVYPTTNSGYGVGETGKFCTEESPLRPISLYGTTKVEAEKAVLDSGRGVSLRLATVFGMGTRMRLDLLVNDFTHRP